MANIPEILSRKWRGAAWRMDAVELDSYATLFWLDAQPKPTEAEIRAFSAEVDAEILSERRQATAQKAILYDKDGALLKAIETLCNAVFEIGGKIKTSALDAPLNPDVIVAMQTLRQRIIDERNR